MFTIRKFLSSLQRLLKGGNRKFEIPVIVTDHEMIGKSIDEVYPPDMVALINAQFEAPAGTQNVIIANRGSNGELIVE